MPKISNDSVAVYGLLVVAQFYTTTYVITQSRTSAYRLFVSKLNTETRIYFCKSHVVLTDRDLIEHINHLNMLHRCAFGNFNSPLA
jgi:hypothetical protein